MEQSPFWGANTFSANQEFLGILCNPQFLNRVYCRRTPVLFTSHINPVYAFPSYLKSILILCPHLTSVSSKWFLCFRFSHKNSICLGARTESKIMFACHWLLCNCGSRSDGCRVLNGAWVDESDQSNPMKSCTDLAMLCLAMPFSAVPCLVRFVAFEWNWLYNLVQSLTLLFL